MEVSIATNIRATSQLIVNTESLLKTAKGHAIFFDDPVKTQRFHASYGMTKEAQICMARSWQEEGAASGITVHIETPAPMPTATRARFYPGEDRGALTPCAKEAARLLSRLL